MTDILIAVLYLAAGFVAGCAYADWQLARERRRRIAGNHTNRETS